MISHLGLLVSLTILIAASAQCNKDTGGTCATGICFAWRGGAECNKEQKCVCPEGSCAKHGECVKEGECPKSTGGGCAADDCYHWRNAECSPIALFPHPCLHKLIYAVAVMVLGFALMCFSINCYTVTLGSCCKCKSPMLLGILLTVAGAGAFAFGYKKAKEINVACLGVAVINKSGMFHLPYDKKQKTSTPMESVESVHRKQGTETFIPTSLQDRMCVCREGGCAIKGECVYDDCPKNTGGTCSIWGCDSSRHAHCDKSDLSGGSEGKCLCDDSHCVHGGKCVHKDDLRAIGYFNLTSMRAREARPLASASSPVDSAPYLQVFGATALMAMTAFVVVRRFRYRHELSEPLLVPGASE